MKYTLRPLVLVSLALGTSLFLIPSVSGQQSEPIAIDAQAATTPFPHFWEQTFGSGRAILALRKS
jgi:xylan 1,4-beta-xylosidase